MDGNAVNNRHVDTTKQQDTQRNSLSARILLPTRRR